MKVMKRSVWLLLTNFFSIWFVIATVGGGLANNYSSTINAMLGINPYEQVNTGNSNPIYFPSDYLKINGTYDDEAMRNASMDVAERAASEGIVLLWNNEVEGEKALPLKENSRISLFGIGSVDYKYSGGGSGEIKSAPKRNIKAELEETTANGGPGFKVNGTLFNAYSSLRDTYGTSNAQGSKTKDARYNGTNGYVDERYREFYVNEPAWDVVNSKLTNGIEASLVGSKNTKGYNDAAVMVITRDGSEDGDTWFHSNECLDDTYLDLSKEEADILNRLQNYKKEGKIKKIVLILNTAGIMQMKNISQYDIDACILAGCGGVTSHKAIANVLSGKVNPSGRLVDTIPYDIDSHPSTKNFGDFRWTSSTGLPGPSTIGVYNDFYVAYQEGVYVGYKYYETRYEDCILNQGNASNLVGGICSSDTWNYDQEVAFPFGYGLSYTTFALSNYEVSHQDGDFGGTYTASFDVKNTGSLSGKTSVGIYLQKPYTDYDKEHGVEKPSVELVGFTKTDVLNPNETKRYSVEIKGSELKTYDTYGKGTYILEKGDYYLSASFDSHEAIQNILSSKANHEGGTKDLVYKIKVEKDDFVTYSKSEQSNFEIQNQLSDADINLYSGTQDQKIKYLSRNNYLDTYPTSAVSLSCVNDQMVKDMQYGHGDIESVGELPTFDTVTSKVGKLTLAMLMKLDYDDPMWQDLLNQMSFEEMNKMLSGGYLNLYGASSIAAIGGAAADGTSGVRRDNPTLKTQMGFPTQTVMAQTWNLPLIEELGVAFGHECLHTNCVQLYAPGGNLHRNPYGGRNWEYYSEDSYLSGKMLGAEVKGIQKKGIIVCAKHFAFNEQEMNRCGVATWLNEQTAREVYLKVFEIGIEDGKIASLMSSFPRLGCRWVGNYDGLFTSILRNEWGYHGFVETDSAFDQPYMTVTAARAEGIIAGVDFWMDGAPSMQFANYAKNATVVNAVRESTHRMLYAILHSSAMNGVGSDTIIVEITPYWKKAIVVAQISFGVIAGVCLSMSIASIVVYEMNKKKKNHQKEDA